MVIFIIIFFYLTFLNLSGMFPYSFTCTSHLTFTFFVSFSYFIGLNLIAYTYQYNAYFRLFLPSGVPEYIIPLIIIVEFLSFFMRLLSLSIRLFANMMAGHTLLKIVSVSFYFMGFYLTLFGHFMGAPLTFCCYFFTTFRSMYCFFTSICICNFNDTIFK